MIDRLRQTTTGDTSGGGAFTSIIACDESGSLPPDWRLNRESHSLLLQVARMLRQRQALLCFAAGRVIAPEPGVACLVLFACGCALIRAVQDVALTVHQSLRPVQRISVVACLANVCTSRMHLPMLSTMQSDRGSWQLGTPKPAPTFASRPCLGLRSPQDTCSSGPGL